MHPYVYQDIRGRWFMFYWKMSIALPRKTGGKGRWNIETDHDGVRLVTEPD